MALKSAEKRQLVTQQKDQALIDALIDLNCELADAIDRLKAEVARLGGVDGNSAP